MPLPDFIQPGTPEASIHCQPQEKARDCGQRLLQLHTAPSGSFGDLHLYDTCILDYALEASFKTDLYDTDSTWCSWRKVHRRSSQPSMGVGFSKEHCTQIS